MFFVFLSPSLSSFHNFPSTGKPARAISGSSKHVEFRNNDGKKCLYTSTAAIDKTLFLAFKCFSVFPGFSVSAAGRVVYGGAPSEGWVNGRLIN